MAKDGAGGGPDWNSLLKWSLAHGSDGTNPPRALSEEDRKWFMEAMQANTINVVGRMKEIAQVMKTPDDVLQSHGVTPENIEALIRNNQPGLATIRLGNGHAALKDALAFDDARLQSPNEAMMLTLLERINPDHGTTFTVLR